MPGNTLENGEMGIKKAAPEMVERCSRNSRGQNDPYALLVIIDPREVFINQFAGTAYHDYTRALLMWIFSHCECRDMTPYLPKY